MSLTPSWDLFIIAFFIVSIVFGIALGRERAVASVLASYLGLLAANIGGNALTNALSGTSTAQLGDTLSITANTSPFAVKIAIFVLITTLLIAKGDFFKRASTHHDNLTSIIAGGIYSFFNAGIITTAVVSFLSDSQRTELLTQSNLINQIMQYQIPWMLIPIGLMILLGFQKSSSDPQ